MAKTLKEIEKQILALQQEKKEILEKERNADKKALTDAERYFGKIVLRAINADWKKVDPEHFEEWLLERKEKLEEIAVGDELSRADALKRLRANEANRK